jgi:ketosteroid isomerase-like protein
VAADLDDVERLKIRVALEDLNTAFCYHLDHNEVDALLALFTDDVYYTHGSRVSRGKAEIETVFRSRSATQVRTARHMYSGLKLDIESATRARGTCVCMTFADYGEPPLSPAVPTLVADFVDVYEREANGRWRIKERHIHRIFVAPDNTGPIGQRATPPAR